MKAEIALMSEMRYDTFRAIRVRPMEEREQQSETRNRFCRSAGAVEIEDRALACQRYLRETLRGHWDNWL